MLPDNELCAFLLTVEEAIDLARTGKAADGYEALLAGLHHTREADDQPWSVELITRYRDAVERFAEMYSVARA
jgi:hypothetical protein